MVYNNDLPQGDFESFPRLLLKFFLKTPFRPQKGPLLNLPSVFNQGEIDEVLALHISLGRFKLFIYIRFTHPKP